MAPKMMRGRFVAPVRIYILGMIVSVGPKSSIPGDLQLRLFFSTCLSLGKSFLENQSYPRNCRYTLRCRLSGLLGIVLIWRMRGSSHAKEGLHESMRDVLALSDDDHTHPHEENQPDPAAVQQTHTQA